MVLVLCLLLPQLSAAQNRGVAGGDGAAQLYSEALKHQAGSPQRITALEILATRYPSHELLDDTLELLIWEYRRSGDRTRAMNAANRLLTVVPNNPVAAVIVAENQPASAANTERAETTASEQGAQRALTALEVWRRPQALPDAEYSRMSAEVRAALSRVVGHAALRREDYATAQTHLRQAVEQDPNNAQDVYALALAYLMAEKSDREQGFWFLARAVNLSGATPESAQINAFALEQYKEAGGSEPDWNRFLAAASTATMPPARETVVAQRASQPSPERKPAPQQDRASKADAKDSEKKEAKREKQRSRRDKDQTEAKAKKPKRDSNRESARTKEPDLEARAAELARKDAERRDPLIPTEPFRRKARAGEPVSLGILIEASSRIRDKRSGVFRGLVDTLYGLGLKDEAFILTFSNELVMEQDLTDDPKTLYDALEQIESKEGNALYDAVSAAAGHLRRIAKNQNRVLLVVADSADTDSQTSPYLLRNNLRDVTVYCIGVDVAQSEQKILERLAALTGGRASFVQDASQFPAASQLIARNIYGEQK